MNYFTLINWLVFLLLYLIILRALRKFYKQTLQFAELLGANETLTNFIVSYGLLEDLSLAYVFTTLIYKYTYALIFNLHSAWLNRQPTIGLIIYFLVEIFGAIVYVFLRKKAKK